MSSTNMSLGVVKYTIDNISTYTSGILHEYGLLI